MKAETTDYLAKARATLADAGRIATLPLPDVAASPHRSHRLLRIEARMRSRRYP